MTKLKSTKILTAIMFVVTGAILLSTTACSTIPDTVKEDITLERQVEVRIPEAVFDTNFSRDQYTIIGMVSGEGTVRRRLVEEGIKPEPSFWDKLFNKKETKKDMLIKYWANNEVEEVKKDSANDSYYSYYSYYVLDYNRKYGSWSDEGFVNVDYIGDNKMVSSESAIVRKMEKIAARIALYNAINTDMDIDAILMPKYNFTYEMQDEIFGKEAVIERTIKSVTAKVYGKAIRIKTDEELMATYKEFPALLNNTDTE